MTEENHPTQNPTPVTPSAVKPLAFTVLTDEQTAFMTTLAAQLEQATTFRDGMSKHYGVEIPTGNAAVEIGNVQSGMNAIDVRVYDTAAAHPSHRSRLVYVVLNGETELGKRYQAILIKGLTALAADQVAQKGTRGAGNVAQAQDLLGL